MSTRGVTGFVIDGQEKIAYNHSDSAPDGLGLAVLDWCRGITNLADVRNRAREVRVLPDNTDATTEETDQLRTPDAILSAGYVRDFATFPLD